MGVSRNTVRAALRAEVPPRYERVGRGVDRGRGRAADPGAVEGVAGHAGDDDRVPRRDPWQGSIFDLDSSTAFRTPPRAGRWRCRRRGSSKWRDGDVSLRQARRRALAAQVGYLFTGHNAATGRRGSPPTCGNWAGGCRRTPSRSTGWALLRPRGDPHRVGHVDREVLPAHRRARADLAALAGPGPCRRPTEGAVAGAGGRAGRAGRGQARRGAHGVGVPQGVGNDPPRRAPGVASTTLRILRRRGMVQPTDYTRERRQLAAARRAAFLVPPTAPKQVWQLDFQRVRHQLRRHLADRRGRGLLVQVRVRLALSATACPGSRSWQVLGLRWCGG
jgi:hypothetical protein